MTPDRTPTAESSHEDATTRAYLEFINDPQLDVTRYLEGSPDPEEAHVVLEILESRGLVELPGDGTVVVPPPETALPAYAAAIESQARRMRASASQMGMVHRRARERQRAAERDESVRLLRSVAEIRVASNGIASGAELSVLCARADSVRTRAFLDPGGDHDTLATDSTGHPLPMISVYDSALLEAPGVIEVLRRRQRAGEQVRLIRAVPYSTVVVDERTAVLDVSNIDVRGVGSAVVDGGPLVVALARYVRRLYDAALPMPDPRDDGATPLEGLTDRDRLMLTLLAAGTSDALVARQLGLSVRTVERRVRHVMHLLGTSSRLQTGVEAARRGLL